MVENRYIIQIQRLSTIVRKDDDYELRLIQYKQKAANGIKIIHLCFVSL